MPLTADEQEALERIRRHTEYLLGSLVHLNGFGSLLADSAALAARHLVEDAVTTDAQPLSTR